MASITEEHDPKRPVLVRWTGTVEFTQTPVPDKVRLLIREYEYVSENYMRILTRREHENYCDREHLT
jgi:hypothetical protein